MDKLLYDRGLAKRRHVLGESYVNRALANANGFNGEFQRLVTEYCWGEVWGGRDLIGSRAEHSYSRHGRRTREDGRICQPCAAAAVNGLTPNELSAVLIQIAIYCGIPVGADCFQVAESILSENKPT